ncbi:MAG: dCMP deaminase family protein [Chloracidobacterium sp.]|nr:dCMP deaminase family protein [Chloracidobacterium sp.]
MAIGKWDKRFIGLALHVAEWSKDPSTRVGAVIVDNKQRVISMGYNGPPRGVSDHYVTREDKLFKTIHAEENAVLFAKQDLTGATAYVTHPPCANCAAKLVQSGVTRVVFPAPSEDFLSRWKESYYAALGMFVEAGVAVETGE